jgi:hypothetical protein
MNATTVVIAVTVDGDHATTENMAGRLARLLDRHWDTEKLPRRVAQDIRVHKYGEGAIGDLLNKVSLGER